MTKPDLFQIKNDVSILCAEVASFIRAQLNKVKSEHIETKDLNSLVSYVDKEAEQSIVSRLRTLLPEAGFITEEDTKDDDSKDWIWIVDPLDGTTNFLYKIPHFSISIALSYKGEVIFGIVYEIMLDIAYTAIKNEGAWENDRPMHVSRESILSNALIVTGFPYRRNINIDISLGILKECLMACRGVRRLGSAALDLAYVAAGKIDVYYENALNIWDIAAGALLVEEAGGKISDYEGKAGHLNSGEIISANPHFYHFIKDTIAKHRQAAAS